MYVHCILMQMMHDDVHRRLQRLIRMSSMMMVVDSTVPMLLILGREPVYIHTYIERLSLIYL